MLDFDLNEAPLDRRDSSRVPFAGNLGVADYNGREVPTSSSFRHVQGFDLSHSGISFATRSWPSSDQLVVSLGDQTEPALVTARVVACARTLPLDDPMFEVRCQFVEWLDS